MTATVGTRKLTALGENVLIRMHNPDTVTSGGIFLPTKGQEAPDQGIVLSVGPDAQNLGINEDDEVIFVNYTGDRRTVHGSGSDEKIAMVQGKEVLARVEEE